MHLFPKQSVEKVQLVLGFFHMDTIEKEMDKTLRELEAIDRVWPRRREWFQKMM